MSKKMPQTVKKMQKINIKYLNDIAVFFIIIFYIFFYGLKYKKSLPHRVKSFFKIGHFLGHFYFAFYALKNLVFAKMSLHHLSSQNYKNAFMIISLPFFSTSNIFVTIFDNNYTFLLNEFCY